MDYLTYHTGKFGFAQLHTQHSLFENAHYFDASGGKKDDSFGYILKGHVSYHFIGGQLEIPCESLFYIPNGLRYNAVWRGSPEIEFYSLHKVQRQWEIDESDAFALQWIPEMSNAYTGQLFRQIHDLLASDDEIDHFHAYARFFDFYAQAVPFLRRQLSPVQSKTIRSAMAYIESHCLEDFSVSDVAKACYISETWLYHLFQRELHASPLQIRNECRLEKAAQYLRDTDSSIDEIAAMSGFHSASFFREVFRSHTGMTPMGYRRTVLKRKLSTHP